jgi:hypothetical protein
MDAEKIREWLKHSPPPNPKHDMTLGWIDEQGQWICPECSSRLTGRGCSYVTRGTKPTYDQAGLPCIGCGKSVNPPDENDFEEANTGCASAVDARAMLAESQTVRADFEPQQYAVAANPEHKPDAYKIYRRLKAGRPITAKFLGLSYIDMIGEVNTRRGASAKLGKSKKEGFWTPGLYLASGTVAGFNDLCPFASDRCRENCLLAAGRRQQMADFTALKIIGMLRRGKPLTYGLNGCLLRTYLYLFNYPEFVRLMDEALAAHSALTDENNFELAVRLNGTSDIAWEDPNVEPHDGHSIVLAHPEIHFYDYTKNPNRALRFAGDTSWPKNYYLTFSYSEINLAWCLILLRMGVNITVPFDGSFGSEEYGKIRTTPTGGKFRANRPKLPRSLFGRDVVDGDAFDMRFLDATDYWQQQGFGPPPYVAGLRPKGTYARRRMDQNWFFFDAAMAQSHGADPEFIADQVYQNTRECIRQGQSDTLPGGDLLDLLDPAAREAFVLARKGE